MRLDLDQLRALEAVGRHASVTAAAAELYRSPSTVSYAVRRLEDALGVTLLDRSGHHVRLTAAGEVLVAEARTLLAQAEHTERRVRLVADGWEPRLTIAVSDLLPMGRVLELVRRFGRVAPQTEVRVTREVLSGGWDALVSARADLALGVPEDGAPAVPVEMRPLAEVRFVFVLSPDHPLAALPAPLEAEQVAGARAVAASDSTRGLPARTLRILAGQSVLSVPDQLTKREAIRRGLGVGFLPAELVADDIARGRLVSPKLAFSNDDRARICYAWRAGETGRGLRWLTQRMETEVRGGDWTL